MESLDIRMNLEENPWQDLIGAEFDVGKLKAIGFIPEGTAQGHPTVALRIELENGQTVLAETTMALFVTAARGGLARYGEPG